MNVADVISRVKRTFGDESGAQITDDDIIRWINDAQNEIAAYHKLFEVRGFQTTVAGTPDYSLPDSLISLLSVYYDTRVLEYLPEQEFDEYIRKVNDGLTDFSAEPCIYTSWGNKITLFPSPVDAKELEIKFICFPAPVEGTTDQLNLPLRYHNRLVEAVLANAYELDENYEARAAKMAEYSNNMADQAGDEQWDGKSLYPTITVLLEDL